MIRKLMASALVVLIVGVIASSALAVTFLSGGRIVQPPGGTIGKPIRTTQTLYFGWNIVRIVTVEDPVTHCKTTTTTRYAFFVPIRETVETVCP